MSMLNSIAGSFSRWIDSVAKSIDSLADRYRSRRVIRLIENDDGTFTFQIANTAGKNVTWLTKRRLWRPRKRANTPGMLVGSRIVDGALTELLPVDWMTALRGSRVEVILHPRRFLFRALELPRQAVEFLEGIVRSQIDRLTPWHANEAVFGWTRPVEADDRIKLSVVATARNMVSPYVSSLTGLGTNAISVSTTMPPDAGPVTVLTTRAQNEAGAGRLRRVSSLW